MWAALGQPSVIIENDTIKMWYAQASGTDPDDTVLRGRIRYAWSLDGIEWIDYPENPVLDVGETGSWDDEWLDTPEILKVGDVYYLYYYGDSTYFEGQDNTNIGLATSPDGINWTRQGIVLSKGGEGEWDSKYIESPAAYYDEITGKFMIWYQGQNEVGYINIGLATSDDGISWTKYENNPILELGPWLESWDDMFIAVPAVIKHEDIFEMFYSGVNFEDQWDTVSIGYAISQDGYNWIKHPMNPVLETMPDDSAGFWAVDVVWCPDSSKYAMYYENTYVAGSNAVYYAESDIGTVVNSNDCNTNVSNDVSILSGGSALLAASGGSLYHWMPEEFLDDPYSATPLATPTENTMFYVMIVADDCVTRDSVYITVEETAVDQIFVNSKVSISPNPADDYCNISLSGNVKMPIKLLIYNLLGLVQREYIIKENTLQINTSELKSGTYVFELIIDENKIRKLVVIE